MKYLAAWLLATCIASGASEWSDLDELPTVTQLLQTKLSLQRIQRPNLLFIVLDQWRWDWDGTAEHGSFSLPTIDALGKSGARFTRAYTPSPLCVPARSALAAVREYKDMWVKNNSKSYVHPGATPSFMSVLQSVGYSTMLVGKDHLSDGQSSLAGTLQAVDMDVLGVDWYVRAADKYSFCWNFPEPVDAYSEYLKDLGLFQSQCQAYGNFSTGESCAATQVCDSTSVLECGFRCPKVNPLDENHSVDTWVRRSAEKLLHKHRETYGPEKPWFLQVNFLGPHPPLVPSHGLQWDSLPASLPRGPVDGAFGPETWVFTEREARRRPHPFLARMNVTETRLIYAQHLIRIDREIKFLLETLERLDMRQNSLIVVTGDHGDHLGDHGHWAKASPFEASLHVPLLLAGHGVPQGGLRVEHPVSLLDVPMTFLELAKAKPLETMQGYSLLPLLDAVSEGHRGPPNSEELRPAVMFGLNYLEEFTVDNGELVSLGRKHFEASAAMFGKDFLKLICCPSGCRKQGRLLPDMFTAQVALMNVTDRTEHFDGFEYNILTPKSRRGIGEALHLAKFLGPDFQKVCLPLLHAHLNST